MVQRVVHPVVPAVPHQQIVVATTEEAYHIVMSRELPVINCSKEIKTVLLGGKPRVLQVFDWVVTNLERPLLVCFFLGCLLNWTAPLMDLPVYRWTLPIGCTLESIPLLVAAMRYRYDIVLLVIRSYEFWYINTINVITTVIVCKPLGDSRALTFLLCAYAVMNVALIDANYHNIRTTVTISYIGSVCLLAFIVGVGFDVIPTSYSYEIHRFSDDRVLRSEDIIINGMFTIVVMLLRNSFRRQFSVSHRSIHVDVVRCITIRSRLKLVVRNDPRNCVGSNALATKRARMPRMVPSANWTTQLLCAPIDTVIDSRQTLLPMQSFLSVCRHARGLSRAFTLLGCLGLALNTLAVVLPQSAREEATYIRIISLVCTLGYCGPCMGCYNQRLAWRLVTSFDFLFVVIQTLLAHLTLCHLFYWEERALVVCIQLIWIVWVLSLDLLTPVTKRTLSVKTGLAILTLLVQIFGVVFVAVSLVVGKYRTLKDRRMLAIRLSSREFHLDAIPFVVGRAFSVVPWYVRLLWRLSNRSENEIIMLQGIVEYEDYMLQRLPLEREENGTNEHK